MKEDDKAWRGYDLDELRIRRLVSLTKIELEHMRLKQFTDRYTNKSAVQTSHSLLSKLFGAFDYLDYGILAYQIGKRALSLLRRRKKKN